MTTGPRAAEARVLAVSASRRGARLGLAPVSRGDGPSLCEAVPAGGRHHGRVVGAHRPAGQERPQAVGHAGVEEPLAQLGVGGHSPGQAEALGAVLPAARRALVTSTSTTASWNEAATSAVTTSGCLRTWFTTAVLSPLNEKS